MGDCRRRQYVRALSRGARARVAAVDVRTAARGPPADAGAQSGRSTRAPASAKGQKYAARTSAKDYSPVRMGYVQIVGLGRVPDRGTDDGRSGAAGRVEREPAAGPGKRPRGSPPGCTHG